MWYFGIQENPSMHILCADDKMQANAFKFFEHKFRFSQMKCSVTSVFFEKFNIKALQKFPTHM